MGTVVSWGLTRCNGMGMGWVHHGGMHRQQQPHRVRIGSHVLLEERLRAAFRHLLCLLLLLRLLLRLLLVLLEKSWFLLVCMLWLLVMVLWRALVGIEELWGGGGGERRASAAEERQSGCGVRRRRLLLLLCPGERGR